MRARDRPEHRDQDDEDRAGRQRVARQGKARQGKAAELAGSEAGELTKIPKACSRVGCWARAASARTAC
jgi:hypothetical protein